MAKRLWTNYYTTAANANEQLFDFLTEDDYRTRHVKSVFVGISTSGVALTLYSQGQEYSKIDCTRFAAGDAVLHVEFDLPAKMTLKIGLQNKAGAALTNVPIILGYETDAGSGP